MIRVLNSDHLTTKKELIDMRKLTLEDRIRRRNEVSLEYYYRNKEMILEKARLKNKEMKRERISERIRRLQKALSEE